MNQKKIKIIPKTPSFFKKEPNLQESDLNKDFSWPIKKEKMNLVSDSYQQKIALFWEGEDGEKKKFTFSQMSRLSSQFGNLLKRNGVKKGDRVFFFLPRVPALYYGLLGTLKVGAIAGTLFSAFGENALVDRLGDCDAKILITNKKLKKRVDKIRKKLPYLKKIILVEDLEKLLEKEKTDLKIVKVDPEESAFMLYTSGTTGKPKGIVHCHQAILLGKLTAQWVLDLKDDDVFWCTADPGWVTGIAYGILAPWVNGITQIVYEGRFDPEKWFSLIQDYHVSVWYTAPTAIRMLASKDSHLAKKFNLSSLRHLASVGEPLNPEAIFWGLKTIGLPFHDNWWQTETGGILIANYPCLPIKPGSMGKPIPGIKAEIIDEKGNLCKTKEIGNLAIKPPWPSMMKTIWRRQKKYKSYFKKGWYISGDLAYKDKDGYFWFVGRNDDIIKTGGERVGPFEVESSLLEHFSVAEAGVIGKPDPLRGEIIKAFVVLKPKEKPSEALKLKLQEHVKRNLAGHAYPREIEFVKVLPKTRSGKIMRRVLKAKEMGLPIGDTSTLEKY